MSKCGAQIDVLAAMFKALANPQRLRIFIQLASCCGPTTCAADDASLRRCVGELGADLGLAASTVSHHLKELRQAGLMRIERRGKSIECWLAAEALQALQAFFGEPFAAVQEPAADETGEARCKTSQAAAGRRRAERAVVARRIPARD